MPSCTSLIRLLRRRLVLGLIFALSLTYCAFSLLRNEKAGTFILSRSDYIDNPAATAQYCCYIVVVLLLQKVLLFSLQKGSPNLDNDLDMDSMMINDNNEDLLPDDNMLEELRASDKSPLWQVEILDRAVNDNTGNMDASNLNDTSVQSCRNSIQVSICLNMLPNTS